MVRTDRVALGLDFGTESVRAVLVDLAGAERGGAAVRFPHGQILDRLPAGGDPLPADFALQHPDAWLASAGEGDRRALGQPGLAPRPEIRVGVGFASCTDPPPLAHGTPLYRFARYATEPHAW